MGGTRDKGSGTSYVRSKCGVGPRRQLRQQPRHRLRRALEQLVAGGIEAAADCAFEAMCVRRSMAFDYDPTQAKQGSAVVAAIDRHGTETD